MKITNRTTQEEYYQALVDRNPGYLGSFYVGVKTTGIFCISTCRARKPKFKNVEFFTQFKEVLDQGYRPCKVCKPTQQQSALPDFIQQALNLLERQPKEKVGDAMLRAHHIAPEKVRRWFQKNYGITYHTYQRMLRINYAYQELQSGRKVTDVAFSGPYESLSGFGYTYKKLMGKSPEQMSQVAPLLLQRLETPLGPMFACASDQGLCLLEFVDRRMLETEFGDLQRYLKRPILIGTNPHLEQVKQELAAYFAGKRTQFEVALHHPGTAFQQQVWLELQKIPFGVTTTYQHLAALIDNPKAVRAIASANGYNRLAIIVPCHRIIGKDGALRGYGGGLERKRWLLEHEAKVCKKNIKFP